MKMYKVLCRLYSKCITFIIIYLLKYIINKFIDTLFYLHLYTIDNYIFEIKEKK